MTNPGRGAARPKYDWDGHKDTIVELYEEQGFTDMENTMKERGFAPSRRAYFNKFKHWGVQKNLKGTDMSFIAAKREKRKRDESKETEFIVRERLVPDHKIKRFERRTALEDSPVKDREEQSAHDAPTPEYIRYQSPSHTDTEHEDLQPAETQKIQLGEAVRNDTQSENMENHTWQPTISAHGDTQHLPPVTSGPELRVFAAQNHDLNPIGDLSLANLLGPGFSPYNSRLTEQHQDLNNHSYNQIGRAEGYWDDHSIMENSHYDVRLDIPEGGPVQSTTPISFGESNSQNISEHESDVVSENQFSHTHSSGMTNAGYPEDDLFLNIPGMASRDFTNQFGDTNQEVYFTSVRYQTSGQPNFNSGNDHVKSETNSESAKSAGNMVSYFEGLSISDSEPHKNAGPRIPKTGE